MGRTESGRAAHGTDARGEILHAAARAWDGEPALRHLAIAVVAVLLVLDAIAFVLLAGMPLLVVGLGLLVPAVPFALVVGAFRAIALARFGDVRPRPERLGDTVRRVAGRAPEVLLVSWRALQRDSARTPLAAAVVVVNGVSADEGARTSRALVMRRFGERATLRITTTVMRRYLVPMIAGLAVVAFVAPRLGMFGLPLVALAVAAATVVAVVAVAVDAALRGLALRAARGDEQALGSPVTAVLIRR